jgi:hypothetical protein
MALIELTAEQRNGVAFAKTILVNTDTIAVPVREIGGKSYIGVNENILDGRQSERIDIVYYLVTEDLATIVGLSYSLFRATVTTRDGRTPSSGYTDMIFRLDRVVGNIIAEGSGSKFLYHEDNGSEPVTFVVSQAPSAIVSQTTIPAIPPVDNVLRYKALLTQSGTDAPVATVLEDTLGDIYGLPPALSYNAVGTYDITLTGAFTVNKTFILTGEGLNFNLTAAGFRYEIISEDVIRIYTYAYDLADLSSYSLANDKLNNFSILIEVYP